MKEIIKLPNSCFYDTNNEIEIEIPESLELDKEVEPDEIWIKIDKYIDEYASKL